MATQKRTSRSRFSKQKPESVLHDLIAEQLIAENEEEAATLEGQSTQQKAMLFGLRQQLGVTQAKLADLLGISLPSISRYEREGKMMPMRVAARLAELAKECGDRRRAQWFRDYVSFVVKEHSGFDESELDIIDKGTKQLASAFDEVLQLDWKINPTVDAVANQEVRQRAVRLWGKLQALIFGYDAEKENT
jgi:transcriptional regulator with XRE-family HTH domain